MRGGGGSERGMMGIAWGEEGGICKGLLRNRMSKVAGFTLFISSSLFKAKYTKALCV